jgi:hypothetical protein
MCVLALTVYISSSSESLMFIIELFYSMDPFFKKRTIKNFFYTPSNPNFNYSLEVLRS